MDILVDFLQPYLAEVKRVLVCVCVCTAAVAAPVLVFREGLPCARPTTEVGTTRACETHSGRRCTQDANERPPRARTRPYTRAQTHRRLCWTPHPAHPFSCLSSHLCWTTTRRCAAAAPPPPPPLRRSHASDARSRAEGDQRGRRTEVSPSHHRLTSEKRRKTHKGVRWTPQHIPRENALSIHSTHQANATRRQGGARSYTPSLVALGSALTPAFVLEKSRPH